MHPGAFTHDNDTLPSALFRESETHQSRQALYIDTKSNWGMIIEDTFNDE